MAITTDNTFDRYKNKKTSELYTQIIEVFNYQENYLNGLSQQHLWDLCSLAVNTAPAIATGKYFYSLVNEITIRVKDFQELQETGSCQEGETCYTEEEENPDDHIDVIDQAHLSRISQQYDVPGQILSTENPNSSSENCSHVTAGNLGNQKVAYSQPEKKPSTKQLLSTEMQNFLNYGIT